MVHGTDEFGVSVLPSSESLGRDSVSVSEILDLVVCLSRQCCFAEYTVIGYPVYCLLRDFILSCSHTAWVMGRDMRDARVPVRVRLD